MPRLRHWSVLVGGVLAGLAAAALIATSGALLEWNLFPWSHTAVGYAGRASEWVMAFAVVAPLAVLCGMGITLACAVVFEFVTRRGGWSRGLAVGLFAGAIGASLAGLVPWIGEYYGYTYLPRIAPFGPYDPAWMLAVATAAAVVAGVVGGAWYGAPSRSPEEPSGVLYREVYRRGNGGKAEGPPS
jgi:hypothetical protein